MSSGTSGSLSFPTPSTGKTASYRSWSGGDGRYESYAGGIRPKWNNYTVEQATQTCIQQAVQYRCLLPGGGTDTRFANVGNCYRPSSSGHWAVFTDNEILKLQARLLDKVKGHSFNMAVNLAQTRQVANMVVDNLGKLGRSIRALKSGDFPTAARQLGAAPRPTGLKTTDISGRWLELQYGWLPLLSDTYEAGKALEAATSRPRTATFYQSARKTTTATYSTDQGLLQRLHVRKIGYSFEMSEDLSQARQLGLTNPASVVWEVIPYSFVVDWFVPIGTYLDNLNQIPKLKGRWLIHSGYTTEGTVAWVPPSPLPNCGYHGGAHKYQVVSIRPVVHGRYHWSSRTVWGFPPKVPFPKFVSDGAVHGNRVWNAIALAAQRFLR